MCVCVFGERVCVGECVCLPIKCVCVCLWFVSLCEVWGGGMCICLGLCVCIKVIQLHSQRKRSGGDGGVVILI